MDAVKIKKHKKILGMSLVIILVLGGFWYKNRPRPEEVDFETMILNAQVAMESVPQDTPWTSEVLERFMPRLYVAKDSYKPVDFYSAYVTNSSLYKEGDKKELVKERATREDVTLYSSHKNYYLDYQVPYKKLLTDQDTGEDISSKFYGRVYRSVLDSNLGEIPLLYLKYNFAYPYSGLPEGTKWWKKIGAHLIGNPMTWHELDIHGAVHIVLHEESMTPLGVILAQHNHHRVYLKTIDFQWPEDDHLEIIVAKYSNEPYLLTDGTERYERVVGNPMDISFLFGLADKEPLAGGYDFIPKVEDAVVVEGQLLQLAFDDPLYRSVMSLGERKSVLGFSTWFMDGPPGMDFYAMPDLLDLSNTLAFWYIDDQDETYKKMLEETDLSSMNLEIEDLLIYQKKKMYQHLKEIIEELEM